MRARRIGRALRLGAAALAAVAVGVAGGSVAASAGTDASPCDDDGIVIGEAPRPCVETAPPTTTEPPPVEQPPETETTPPPPPPTAAEPSPPPERRERPTPPPAATPPPSRPAPSGDLGERSAPVGRGPVSETPKLSGGPYVFPVIGPASFSDTWGAPRATVAWHHGVDIFAPLGTPIVAVADGVLFSVGWNAVGGWRLWLRDREGNYFYYAHLSAFAPLAVDGARVRAGTVVGYVGDTGDAEGTPYHLHFEIHPVSLLSLGYDGAVNPFPYVSSWLRLNEALANVSIGGELGAGAAPAPGAILLGYTDISSASGLAPSSLEDMLDEHAAVAAQVYEPDDAEEVAAPSARPIPPAREDDARIARELDLGATRAVRYSADVWDTLALCESGGDWGANTGNGFFGGLQFLPGTWASHGGLVFAASAHLATREQQIAIAQRVLETQGWGAWPACSAVLGLWALAHE